MMIKNILKLSLVYNFLLFIINCEKIDIPKKCLLDNRLNTPPGMELSYRNWTSMLKTEGEVTIERSKATQPFFVIISCKALYPVQLIYEANEWENVRKIPFI